MKTSLVKRWLFLGYGVGCYLLFLATYAYLVGFAGNWLVPGSIDAPATTPLPLALAVDIALLGLFAVQHSLMARPAFKAIWTRVIPRPVERSTYVLASCLALLLVMWQWHPIGPILWDVQGAWARGALVVLGAVGWLLVPAVSVTINHFDLFGLRQVWLHWCGQPYTPIPFRTPVPYNWVRHPLYVAWALAFWATPTMTLGHVLFAGLLSVYMVAASRIEERDLIDLYGRTYAAYQRQVPAFVPRLLSAAWATNAPPFSLPDESADWQDSAA